MRIQRVPRGLNELLSIFGGNTPVDLEDKTRLTLDSLQFYGLTQRRVVSAANAALAPATGLPVVLPAAWNLLYCASVTVVGNAALTALQLNVQVNGIMVASTSSDNRTTAIGNTLAFFPGYPLLLEPGSVVQALCEWAGVGNLSVRIDALVSPSA